jgi:hypothetical protein
LWRCWCVWKIKIQNGSKVILIISVESRIRHALMKMVDCLWQMTQKKFQCTHYNNVDQLYFLCNHFFSKTVGSWLNLRILFNSSIGRVLETIKRS